MTLQRVEVKCISTLPLISLLHLAYVDVSDRMGAWSCVLTLFHNVGMYVCTVFPPIKAASV